MCNICGNPNHLVDRAYAELAKKIVGSDNVLEYNILEAGEKSLFEKSPNSSDYNSYIPVSGDEANFIRDVMLELNQITGITFIETDNWEDSWLIIFQTDYYPDHVQDIGWLNTAKDGSTKWMEASWAHGKGSEIPDELQNWEKGTIRHELGHALGLQHPQGKGNNKNYSVKDSIMSYRGDQDKYFEFTNLDKIALKTIWDQDFITGIDGLAKGTPGNDSIYASSLGDKIYSGKGLDNITCGGGEDWIWLSKKTEKGKNNYDIIHNFEVGVDWVGFSGNVKGLYLDEKNGDALILKRNNPLAIIEGAAGELNWLKEEGTWWIG